MGDAATGRVVLWNPAAERLFGYSADEMVGCSLELLVPAGMRERHRAGTARYAETGLGPLVDGGRPVQLPGSS